MSVCIVPDAHINALTTWAALRRPTVRAVVGGQLVMFGTDRVRIAHELHRCNVAAFNARYRETVSADDFEPALLPAAASLTPGQVWELLEGLQYQCCEAPDWETCEASGLVRQLFRAVGDHKPGQVRLWVLDEPAQLDALAGLATA